MLELLHEGFDGKVYRVNETTIAKVFEDELAYLTELLCLSQLRGVPHICQIIGYDLRHRTITMKRYTTDLHFLRCHLSFDQKIKIIDSVSQQLYCAIRHLHAYGIVHDDISLKNIFCDYGASTIHCYLGDFANAHTLTSADELHFEFCATMYDIGWEILQFIDIDNYPGYISGSIDLPSLPPYTQTLLRQIMQYNSYLPARFMTNKSIVNIAKPLSHEIKLFPINSTFMYDLIRYLSGSDKHDTFLTEHDDLLQLLSRN